MGYLSETTEAGKFDIGAAMIRVIRQGGPGGLRQLADIIKLRLQGRKTNVEEYYTYGLWRPDRGNDFLQEFVPSLKLQEFNAALEMPSQGIATETIRDKLATEGILRTAGLPVVETKAAFLPDPTKAASHARSLPSLRILPDAESIRAYLGDPSVYPLFGKPVGDSFARGAVAMTQLEPDGQTLRFSNRRLVPVAGLADEIVADWTEGYLFQPFHACQSDLRSHVGPAMASVRIVTLQTDAGAVPWYAVIRIPAKTAMHDGDATDTRIWGLIDLASGKITRLRNLRDPMTADLTHWLNKDTPFLGFTLPNWPETLKAVVIGHSCFRGHGILGWDVFFTDEGALLNEVNSTPGPVYQIAAGRGMLNRDMAPLYEQALEFARSTEAQAGDGSGST